MIFPDDELEEEFHEAGPGRRRLGLAAIIITLLLVLAILASLIWPLLQAGPRRYRLPTPSPSFLQEV